MSLDFETNNIDLQRDNVMEKKAVIYARVSSVGDRQSTDRQVFELKAYADEAGLEVIKVFEEKMSGAKENRPVLSECVAFCRDNRVNTLLVSEISRLGRSLKIIVNTLDELTRTTVNVRILDLGIDTLKDGKPNPFGALLISVMGACAEIERRSIYERLQSGKAAKRTNGDGAKAVRPKMSDEEIVARHPDIVNALRNGLSVANAAAVCKCSPTTVQKVKKAARRQAAKNAKSETSVAVLYQKQLLSKTTYAFLTKQGVIDLVAICDWSKEQIVQMRGAGKGTAEEIHDLLRKYGIITF